MYVVGILFLGTYISRLFCSLLGFNYFLLHLIGFMVTLDTPCNIYLVYVFAALPVCLYILILMKIGTEVLLQMWLLKFALYKMV